MASAGGMVKVKHRISHHRT